MKKYKIRYLTLKNISEADIKMKLQKKVKNHNASILVPLKSSKGTYCGMIDNQEVKVEIGTYKAILIAIMLLLGIGIGVWHANNHPINDGIIADESIMPDIGEDVKNMTPDELKAAMQKAVDGEYFDLQMNTNLTFLDGKSIGSIQIINPPSNVNPIAVEIYLQDTKELVYESGAMHPSQYISKGVLKKELKKGNYQALAKVRVYDENSKKEITITEVKMNIIVQN